MKIYKLSQHMNNGYDTYDSCIVCAKNEDKARLIHPSKFVTHYDDKYWYGTFTTGREHRIANDKYKTWVGRTEVDKIGVEYIGEAKKGLKKGVIISSFNAG